MLRLFYMCFLMVAFLSGLTSAFAQPVKIVSWNVSPLLSEGVRLRTKHIQKLNADLQPNILILIEVIGRDEAILIAKALGWKQYYGVVTNWGKVYGIPYFGLETAVISKVPITRAIELDASPDGFHKGFSHEGDLEGIVSEQALSSDGISHIDSLAKTDRGTMRVDLANGLTIFPLHLKSNRVGECLDLGSALKTFKKRGLFIPAEAQKLFDNGFAKATEQHLSNARKRERVLAATMREALKVESARDVLIAGDFNTAYEKGKVGFDLSKDCKLKSFSCAKGPFPAKACSSADGFDDTLGMLEAGLKLDGARPIPWVVLSKTLPRTYRDPVFADQAIDHMAVMARRKGRFSGAERARQTYKSDHYPISTVYRH